MVVKMKTIRYYWIEIAGVCGLICIFGGISCGIKFEPHRYVVTLYNQSGEPIQMWTNAVDVFLQHGGLSFENYDNHKQIKVQGTFKAEQQ